jgi:deoxycytidylate deaminase
MVHLVNAGIKKVVFEEEYANLCHKDIWQEAAQLIGRVYQYKNGKRLWAYPTLHRPRYELD